MKALPTASKPSPSIHGTLSYSMNAAVTYADASTIPDSAKARTIERWISSLTIRV